MSRTGRRIPSIDIPIDIEARLVALEQDTIKSKIDESAVEGKVKEIEISPDGKVIVKYEDGV